MSYLAQDAEQLCPSGKEQQESDTALCPGGLSSELVPVPTHPRVTHPVAVSSTEAKGAGRSWKSGMCPPQEQGGEGTGKEMNMNRCTDRSEHVKEQMGADHHRTSKVASANVAPGDRKSQCHPFAYPVVPIPSTR